MREANPPQSLERSRVPEFFPQFRNAAALAHLANKGRGPRYVLVGGRAWYDQADILTWLESHKRVGPAYGKNDYVKQSGETISKSRRRGRPSKMQQFLLRKAQTKSGGSE
jgi:hypothetical protein